MAFPRQNGRGRRGSRRREIVLRWRVPEATATDASFLRGRNTGKEALGEESLARDPRRPEVELSGRTARCEIVIGVFLSGSRRVCPRESGFDRPARIHRTRARPRGPIAGRCRTSRPWGAPGAAPASPGPRSPHRMASGAKRACPVPLQAADRVATIGLTSSRVRDGVLGQVCARISASRDLRTSESAAPSGSGDRPRARSLDRETSAEMSAGSSEVASGSHDPPAPAEARG